MITLYAWRHLVDRHLSTAIPKVTRFFHRYLLALMPPAIHPSSYLGFKPNPVMLPNAFYHFPINGGWPFNPDWCATFKLNSFRTEHNSLQIKLKRRLQFLHQLLRLLLCQLPL
jgi:hypothetical protein